MAHADYKSNRHKPANLNQLPADIQYLLDDKVGPVISEGLNALYKTKPKHPIDYLAKWLLNHEAAQNNKGTVHETEEKVKAILKKYDDIAEVRKKKEAELEAQRQAVERSEKVFKDKLKAHEYHEEMLKNDLPNFIEKQQNLPAVYIGVLEHPSRPVGEEEEEEFAHLDTSQPKLITYIGASGTQKFVMGRELQPETGITYQVFNPPVVEQAEPVEGEEPVVVEPEPTSIYVPDVTQNPAIVYFRIPKLGAYLACDMTYKSVLSELAFDEGIKERIRVQEERERLKKEKEEKEEDYKRRIEEAQEQGLDTAEIEEEWKTQEWPEVEEKPFEFEEKKYVLCIDTLGEDREVTPEERKYIISLAKEFINNWEESEKKQLSKDVDLWLEYDKNVNKEDFLDTATQKLNDEMTEKYHEDEGDSELHQNYKRAAVTADYYKSKLAEEEVKNMIRSLAKYRVIKFKSLLQNVLYFLGYKKGQVNIPGTNVLEWKEVKKMIIRDTFFSKLDEYEFRGPKDDGYWEKYALVNRMAQKFEKFNAEEIEDYNLGLSILFKYVKSSLEARLLDIQVRRTTKEELKKRREEAIAEDENWVATKEREFEEALAQVQAEVQAKAEAKAAEKEEGEEPEEEEEEEEKFNEEAWKAEWNAKWDEEHPRGTIPEPVVDDVDLDIEKEEEAAP